MVKLADGVIMQNNEIIGRVEQNSRTALVIAAPELLRVVFDSRSIETETISVDGDRVMLGLL